MAFEQQATTKEEALTIVCRHAGLPTPLRPDLSRPRLHRHPRRARIAVSSARGALRQQLCLFSQKGPCRHEVHPHPHVVRPLPRYRYPSDTSDLEWALLERLLPTPACQTPKGGAPEKWPRRRVVDAIRYITDNGAKWRALPADFGIPWRTVFGYFARWAKAGVLRHVLDQLRRRLRLRRRRCPWPVRVIVDSQSVKARRPCRRRRAATTRTNT